ncbi:hypothetical protein [Phenylobacterium zucineum]|uniref:hypothetical protein n=1 Tax=Phenylobacterium zucineum TaxID=284016 RepID=UPI000674D2A8|nr:hypothetical protein [Phenylobacterium zucineum]
MGVPSRFVTEYPERCLALLDAAEPIARKQDLLTSFALLAAASVLVIPYERLKGHHPNKQERGSALYEELRQLERRPWQDAPFWAGAAPEAWQFSRIMGDPNDVASWKDQAGRPSMSAEANTINKRRAGEVLRVMRNALAHGNVVYLNKAGREAAGTPAYFIAFLSRYEEDAAQREKSETDLPPS